MLINYLFLKLSPRFLLNYFKVFSLCTSSQSKKERVIVETSLGKIVGTYFKIRNGQDILAFRGIPYAEPCIGDNRFKPAIPKKEWKGLFDATSDGPMCPKIIRGTNGAIPDDWLCEECLVLNVYTRSLCENLPVLFYIHGGAYTGGSSNSRKACGPQYIMEKDLVFVSINYRIGALGFLCTDTADVPGNNGLKDQVVAIKWVRDHIQCFGGDPNNITLMGQSAGSWAVSTHLISPMSRDLFHKAILLSGSSTTHHYTDNVRWTKKVASECGYHSENFKDLVIYLRSIPWQKFIDISKTWEAFGISNIKWNFHIEKDFGQERFLIEHPIETFFRGDFAKIPILAGFTKDEFGYFADIIFNNCELLNDVNENFEKYALNFCQIDPSSDVLKVSKAIKDFYLKGKPITKENLESLGNMFSDAKISHAVHRLVHLVRKHIDIYYYRLDFVGRYSRVYSPNGAPLLTGSWHADELLYLFVTDSNAPQFSKNDPENIIVNRFMNWISNFTKYGNPNGNNCNSELKWIPTNSENVITLYINDGLSLDKEPFQERFDFWDQLFPLNQKNEE